MSNLVKIKDHEELVKDTSSGAILLSDKNVMNEYRIKKNMMQNARDVNAEINNMKQKMSEIESTFKNDMEEIKQLLRGLVK